MKQSTLRATHLKLWETFVCAVCIVQGYLHNTTQRMKHSMMH